MSFTDFDGDDINFRVNEAATIDYTVNGTKKVANLVFLQQHSKKKDVLLLGGTATGEWSGYRSVTPQNQSDIRRVLSLCGGRGFGALQNEPRSPLHQRREQQCLLILSEAYSKAKSAENHKKESGWRP